MSEFVSFQSQGISWRLNPSHYIDSEILANGFFEEHTTRFVREFVKPGMTVLDVGANFGYYTLLFADLVGTSGRVVAFEPISEFRDRLRRHVELNRFSNVEIFPWGLGDGEGKKEILVGTDSATAFWHDDRLQPRASEIMEIRSLDDLVRQGFLQQLHLIKIDIDGGEPAFFRGARETVMRFKPLMVVEFSQISLMSAGSSVEELREQIVPLGYELYREENGTKIEGLADFQRYAHNCSHSVNIFCVPTA